MPNRFTHHEIEYLASVLAQNDRNDEEVVVLTIRPKDDFRTTNIGIKRQQAERLLDDLKRLLPAATLLLALFLTGCSTGVDVSIEHSNGDQSDAVRTTVEVDLLADESSAPTPPLAHEESMVVESSQMESQNAEITNFAIVVVENNTTIHRHRHTHLHIESRPEPRRKRQAPEPIRIEVVPPKIDPECERYRRAYEARNREWMKLFP